MKAQMLPAALAALLLMVPAGARAEDRNVVPRIEVEPGGSGGARVRIEGSRAPSFTQFALAAPDRVVVDLSGAVLAGPAAEIPGDGHAIRSIRTAMFESRDLSVARVTIELTGPADYDVAVEGTDLVFDFRAHPTSAPAVARADTPEAAAADEAPTADAAREAEAAAAAAAREELATTRARLEAAERERAEAQSQAGALEERAQGAETARAEAERRRRETERRHADAERRRTEEARARAEAEQRAEALRARVAALEEERPVAVDAHAPVRTGVRYARYQEDEAVPEGTYRVQGTPRVMELVGFQQMPSVSRVFIRTDAPVDYRIDEANGTVIVDLPNTRAATLNDLNHLDTRFFDSPVELIDPEQTEAPDVRVRVVIRLRQQVPFTAERTDGEIRLDFQRPTR